MLRHAYENAVFPVKTRQPHFLAVEKVSNLSASISASATPAFSLNELFAWVNFDVLPKVQVPKKMSG
jgi:hypothetical protein